MSTSLQPNSARPSALPAPAPPPAPAAPRPTPPPREPSTGGRDGGGTGARDGGTGGRDPALARELSATRAELAGYRLQRLLLLQSLRKTTSSLSWKVTSPLRRLRRLLSPAPLTEAELIPASAMKSADDDAPGAPPGALAGEGAFPQFVLPCVPLDGWVRVRLTVWSALPSRAHLYWDSGGLFNEAEHLDLGAVGPGETTIEVLHHLPSPVHAFRLDPVRHTSAFAVKAFSVRPLSGLAVDGISLARRVAWYVRGGPWQTSLPNGLKLLLRGDLHGFRAKLRGVLGSAAAGASDYQRWRMRRAMTPQKRQQLRREAESLRAAGAPTFSILLPTYNTPPHLLDRCIRSALGQTYPYLELCIADDASTLPHVRATLQRYAAEDPRVRLVLLERNGGISAATNAALQLATGEFIALLDHDDELAEHALSAVARELAAHPDTDMVYSDEDKLTEAGEHLDPFFKPDWSPELFLACMYTCHLGVYRTSLVRELGGFRSDFDQAQDYDLVLRLTRRTARIRHIPDVLYHWRVTAGSTAGGADAKPTAHLRARAAIADHLREQGRPADVTDGPATGYHRVRFHVRGQPRVGVVIPSACRRLRLGDRDDFWARRCVASLRERASWPHLDVVVVSPPDLPTDIAEQLDRELQPLGARRIAYRLPFNFSQACNAGAADVFARGAEHVLLLNDDIEVVTPDFVEEMLGFSQLPEVGAVGAKLFFPDGLLQHAGVTVLAGNPGHVFYRYPADHPGFFYSNFVHRNWSAVTAACMMVRRDVFEAVGGLDEHFPLNFNDVDLCLRIRQKGYRVVFTPYAELVHHESVTKPGTFDHELQKFHDRWKAALPHDPYYNVNLSYDHGDFRIEP
ncbi:MAG: glycosyltransferase family 2 protein [Tepidisphaerales bacterium]